jgi:hypothetical protein
MLKFLMVCIENERISRISEQTAMHKHNDGRRLTELTEEYNNLRHNDLLRSAEHKCLKDENMALLIKQRQTEQLVREK